MKFGKRYSRGTLAMAVLHGVLIGVAAVFVIGLLLTNTKANVKEPQPDKEIPAAGPAAVETPTTSAASQTIQLYAKQHGAFSTTEAASAFIAEDPALSKAAVIQVNDQYYVWTSVGLTPEEIEVSEYEGTYRKAFQADAASCTAGGTGKLYEILKESEVGKIKMLATAKTDGEEDKEVVEFRKNLTAITSFTEDMRIIRLHLLNQYSHTDKCVKISF